MNRATAYRTRFAVLAALWCALPASARAHAPRSRRAVFSFDGTAAAISMPGFGIAIRPDADHAFSYVCDALLDVPPADIPPQMAFTGGGALLVGSGSGLRAVTAEGCPKSDFGGDLVHARVVALAVHERATNLVYAVTQGASSRLARSEDGGQTWEMRATWPEIDPVSALVLGDTDTNAVYVSQAAPVNRSVVRVSIDGGVSFTTFASDQPRVLLSVEDPVVPAGSPGFWTVGRSPASTGLRGFELVHAPAPEGPWTSALEVNFFGGFAIEPGGAIWVGDEGGGVYRSLDGAATFTNVSPPTAVACLGYAQGAVWGCTPGMPEQPALARWDDAQGSFDAVVALRDVTHLVECDPTLEVATTCAPAWVEWQRDVLMLPPPAPAPAAAGAPPTTESDSSCSIAARTGGRGSTNGTTFIVLAALLLGARKRRKSGGLRGGRGRLSARLRHQRGSHGRLLGIPGDRAGELTAL